MGFLKKMICFVGCLILVILISAGMQTGTAEAG